MLGLLLGIGVVGRDMVVLVGCCPFFFSKSRCTQLSITIPVVASVNLKSGLWSLIFLRHLLLIHSGFCVCSLCNLCSAGVADVSWRVFVMSGSAVMV